MSKKASSTKIGAFVIGTLALVVIVIAVFGSGKIFTKKEHYVIFFRGSAVGLDVGSPVRLMGVDIGEVKEVTALFADNWEFYVEVIIMVEPDAVENVSGMQGVSSEEEITALITRGLRAQLDTQSMVLGLKYVRLDIFEDTEPVFQFLNRDHQEIPSIPTIEQQVGNTLKRLAQELDEIPMTEISQSLLSAIHGVDSLVRDPEVRETIVALHETLGEATIVLREINTQIGPVTTDITEVTRSVTEVLATADTLLIQLRGVAVENQSEIYLSIKELAEASRAMRNLLDYLQRHPDAIIWGKD